MKIFSKLNVWIDGEVRSASGQMALDEAMLRTLPESDSALLRFYLLPEESVTAGFFMKLPEDESEGRIRRDSVVRRLTGGGIVNHGKDVTYSLVVGKEQPLFAEPAVERYRNIHQALCDSLIESGEFPEAELLAVNSPAFRGPLQCFENPVGWDIVDKPGGKKIAGGAQRRSGGALLHQGTVKVKGERSLDSPWIKIFAGLMGDFGRWSGDESLEEMALELQQSRYLTEAWNQRIS